MLRPGTTLGHYEILEPLAAGGMGEVYVARDRHLDRKVAVKVLPELLAGNALALERLEREAKILAGVSHPNVLTVHDFSADDGVRFAVTELLSGEDLGQRLDRDGPLPLAEALPIAIGIGRGLASAHAHKVVHRDIKPANVFLESSGNVKVLDFGLARSDVSLLGGDEAETAEMATRAGAVLGTVGYMSPEQVRGQVVGPASDVFSFGCLLYEMLTAERPFQRETASDTLAAVLTAPPTPPREHHVALPRPLERILGRALEKDPARRYPSAVEMLADLESCAGELLGTEPAGKALLRSLRRPAVAIPVLLALLVVGFFASRGLYRQMQERWARQTALPEIRRLIEAGERETAYDLAERAELWIANDAILEGLFAVLSERVDVSTEPAGAEVWAQVYTEPESGWQSVGTTPIEDLRMRRGIYRWRIEKSGYEPRVTVFRVGNGDLSFNPVRDPLDTSAHLDLILDEQGSADGMVAVEGGPYRPPLVGAFSGVRFDLERYRIDRTEVTNRQFKEFVDAGGYGDPQWWREPFSSDGGELGFEAAMERLHDSTGRPGPAGWVLGSFAAGEEEYPVGGVSWYEAAAYAAFRGKNLPTIYHWIRAALPSTEPFAPIGQEIVALSQIGAEGPRPVAAAPDVGIAGAHDMAGNVREWTSTAGGAQRYSLGAAWNDPNYFLSQPYAQDPWERSPGNGLRLVSYVGGEPTEDVLAAFQPPLQNIEGVSPISDETFEQLAAAAAYEPGPLNAVLDSRTDLGDAVLEWVSVDAAYGGERLPIAILLPKGAPPHQAVIFFGGMHILFRPDMRPESWAHQYLQGQLGSPYLVKEGRALVLPVWEGAFQRNTDGRSVARLYAPNESQELLRHWRHDLSRTLDYLEERADIRGDNVAFMGFSLGSIMAPQLLAFESRVEVAILLAGGFSRGSSQEALNRIVPMVDRMTVPTLILGTAYDTIFPPETHQKTFFERLGTPPEHKRLLIYPTGGHAVLPPVEVINESLAWLAKYQGPVEGR